MYMYLRIITVQFQDRVVYTALSFPWMQIPPQRLLFCETKEGKGSLVRALEVDLHIDSDVDSIEYLQRFVPRLVHVAPRPLIDTNRGDANSSSASIQKKEIMDHSNVRHVRNLVDALYG